MCVGCGGSVFMVYAYGGGYLKPGWADIVPDFFFFFSFSLSFSLRCCKQRFSLTTLICLLPCDVIYIQFV